jgi:hypothetical protein
MKFENFENFIKFLGAYTWGVLSVIYVVAVVISLIAKAPVNSIYLNIVSFLIIFGSCVLMAKAIGEMIKSVIKNVGDKKEEEK